MQYLQEDAGDNSVLLVSGSASKDFNIMPVSSGTLGFICRMMLYLWSSQSWNNTSLRCVVSFSIDCQKHSMSFTENCGEFRGSPGIRFSWLVDCLASEAFQNIITCDWISGHPKFNNGGGLKLLKLVYFHSLFWSMRTHILVENWNLMSAKLNLAYRRYMLEPMRFLCRLISLFDFELWAFCIPRCSCMYWFATFCCLNTRF